MSPAAMRGLGVGLLIAAVVAAVLNLKTVLGLGWSFLPAMLIIFGALLIKRSRSGRR